MATEKWAAKTLLLLNAHYSLDNVLHQSATGFCDDNGGGQ